MTDYTINEANVVTSYSVNLPAVTAKPRTFFIRMPGRDVSGWRLALGNRVIRLGFKLAGIYGAIQQQSSLPGDEAGHG